jgi:hypothetical protein
MVEATIGNQRLDKKMSMCQLNIFLAEYENYDILDNNRRSWLIEAKGST